jgi:hypothetical protein
MSFRLTSWPINSIITMWCENKYSKPQGVSNAIFQTFYYRESS